MLADPLPADVVALLLRAASAVAAAHDALPVTLDDAWTGAAAHRASRRLARLRTAVGELHVAVAHLPRELRAALADAAPLEDLRPGGGAVAVVPASWRSSRAVPDRVPGTSS